MANIILGCDLNKASEDKKTQKTIAKKLEKAGHKVELAPIGPGPTQNLMGKKKNKGKVVVMLVNGADLQTYKDFYVGMTKGYYHTKYAYFGLEGWISPETCSCKGAKTAKLRKAHDDHSSASFTADIVGMTTEQVMEKYKSKIAYACGSSVEELGNNLVNVMGGGSNSSSKSSESTGGSIKDALKKAVSKWDGDVEIRLVEDTVYVQKIKDPTSTKLQISEYDNALYDNITVTDVNPGTVNHLTLKYDNYDLTLQDKNLIKRFGKISQTINADKTVKDLKTAKSFLNREWNKIRRDDGRQVECKVQGSLSYKPGLWVRVFLPSYFIDDYMYITKVSNDEDGTNNWTTNLTLVDYPPSFGVEEESETKTGGT